MIAIDNTAVKLSGILTAGAINKLEIRYAKPFEQRPLIAASNNLFEEADILNVEATRNPAHSRMVDCLTSWVHSTFLQEPSGKTYALVRRAAVPWASWPALATIAFPAPPFLVLSLSAVARFICSHLLTVRHNQMLRLHSVMIAHLQLPVFHCLYQPLARGAVRRHKGQIDKLVRISTKIK